jgi:hypothetical protein
MGILSCVLNRGVSVWADEPHGHLLQSVHQAAAAVN